MPRKNVIDQYHVVAAQSMGASFASSATNVGWLDNISYQVNVSGTPTGSFDVQVSNDHVEENGVVITAGNWITVTPLNAVVTTGSPAQSMIVYDQCASTYVRLIYTRTSGTGTADVYIHVKEI